MTAARVLCADPPWSFGDKLPGASRGAAKNYRVLTLDEICAFELPPLAPDAWLFMWRVSSQVEEAYQVVGAWGFTPKTEIVWEKLTSGGKAWFGMGRYVRAAHETCIVAVRGRVQPKVRNVRSRFAAPAGRHSEKPEAFYSIVEQLTDGPYVELFARRQRPGWACFGDELGKERSPHAQLDAPVVARAEGQSEETSTPDRPGAGETASQPPRAGAGTLDDGHRRRCADGCRETDEVDGVSYCAKCGYFVSSKHRTPMDKAVGR